MKGRVPEVGRTSWSFADQGVVSLGNFLTQIVLARVLAPRDYGVFVLVFSAMLLLNNCQFSIVTYPLSVQGAASDLHGLRKLASFSLLFTALAAAPQAAVVFAVAAFLNHSALTLAIVLALACWQLQETLRRALMAHLRHRGALPGDALSYCGQAAAVWFLARHGELTLSAAFWVIASTSILAALVQAAQLRPVAVTYRESRNLLASFWKLGRWNLFAYALDAATGALFPWTLGLAQGVQEAASYQAASNLVRITHPVIFGVGNLIVPAASHAEREGGIRRAGRSALRYGSQGSLLLLPYLLVLVLWPHTALSLAYGHSSGYIGLTAAVRWFALAYVFSYLFTVLGAFLNGIGHPSKLFAAEVVGAVCALAVGIPLTIRSGVVGACMGFLFVGLARSAAGSYLSWRLVRSDARAPRGVAQGTGQ